MYMPSDLTSRVVLSMHMEDEFLNSLRASVSYVDDMKATDPISIAHRRIKDMRPPWYDEIRMALTTPSLQVWVRAYGNVIEFPIPPTVSRPQLVFLGSVWRWRPSAICFDSSWSDTESVLTLGGLRFELGLQGLPNGQILLDEFGTMKCAFNINPQFPDASIHRSVKVQLDMILDKIRSDPRFVQNEHKQRKTRNLLQDLIYWHLLKAAKSGLLGAMKGTKDVAEIFFERNLDPDRNSARAKDVADGSNEVDKLISTFDRNADRFETLLRSL